MRQQFEATKRRKTVREAASQAKPTKEKHYCSGYHKCKDKTYDPKWPACQECKFEQAIAELKKEKEKC